MAYSEKLRSLAVELYVEGDQSAPQVIEKLREEFPGLRQYPVEDTVRYWAELNRGRVPKAKTASQGKPPGSMTTEVLQRSVRQHYGPQYVEEAVVPLIATQSYGLMCNSVRGSFERAFYPLAVKFPSYEFWSILAANS